MKAFAHHVRYALRKFINPPSDSILGNPPPTYVGDWIGPIPKYMYI
jgi:hypothetical protein